ncbi:hypothetical protein [uncultured Roseibium sp.]|uniref:hypothetical protein n=1 Tax=uncultured Roseibium sp. TaxID=1936171 RepID=UPI00263569E0|nr:hypothetical protein [uncultured Roseibium sp.]
MWFSRTDQGFWCTFCGNLLKPDFHFHSGDEWDEYEAELENGVTCDQCGAPDEFDPEAL